MPGDTLTVRVRHQRGRLALEASFKAPPGITLITGPSASGKTTLFHVISGLISPDVEDISLGDQRWSRLATQRSVPTHIRNIGFAFQHSTLFPHRTVLQNCLAGQRIESVAEIEKHLQALKIGHLTQAYPASLSGGEAARAEIARALCRKPSLLILDEPFAALDADLAEVVARTIVEFVKERQIPALISTHTPAVLTGAAVQHLMSSEGQFSSAEG